MTNIKETKYTIGDGIVTFFQNGLAIKDLLYDGAPPTDELLNEIYEEVTKER